MSVPDVVAWVCDLPQCSRMITYCLEIAFFANTSIDGAHGARRRLSCAEFDGFRWLGVLDRALLSPLVDRSNLIA